MLIQADARHIPLIDGCVQTVVTSPPYFGLRDYGVSGQIGLESTPDAYVSQIVAVFREVRRVLKDDGTVWLNLGDSYASATKGSGGSSSNLEGGKSTQQVGARFGSRRFDMGDAKPKDLLGVPWRVAFALQQPYYAGRIAREQDRIWLAAMVDGEGCFYVHKRRAGLHAGDGYVRQTDSYSCAVEVANTHEAIVQRCAEIAGCGSVIRQDKDRRQPIYRWTARCDEARQITRELYPYLVGKRQQARIVYGMPHNGERAEAAWQAMKLLHAGAGCDVDFPDPPNCLETGWYLRSDVIWSKPNPMPESVTDRPTKAHEYLFLLAKSERYYFDAASVSETSAGRTDFGRMNFGARVNEGGEWKTERPVVKTTRNRRSVWTIPTMPYSGAHFATMPEALVEPCILAGSRMGDLVFDPFIGSGTVGAVATRLGRRWVGTDLNPVYHQLAKKRTAQRGLMFA